MSKEEEKFAKKLTEMFPDHQSIRNWRPNKLKNVNTDKNLEIDFYIGKYALGFEYQGGIHFKDIKRYHNNSDKSRYHDTMKHDLVDQMVEKLRARPRDSNTKGNYKKILSIVEVFDLDLKGNFKLNIINRLKNSIEYYKAKNMYYNAMNLFKAICFLETGVKYKPKNTKAGLVPIEYIDKMRELQNENNKTTNDNMSSYDKWVMWEKKNAKRKKILIKKIKEED